MKTSLIAVALLAVLALVGSRAITPDTASADEPVLTVELETDPEDGGPIDVSVVVEGLNPSGDNCEADFDGASAELQDGDSTTLIECNDADAEIRVTLTATSDVAAWDITAITCVVTATGTNGTSESIIGGTTFGTDSATGTKVIDIVDEEHVHCLVSVDFDPEESQLPFVAVVVTANPNVIPCGGSSVITATARDINGHVVPGVGFHFATSTGLLTVQPNHAANEEGIALLTLQPGMPNSQVTVSVGELLGTVERNDITEKITVQNFCPGQEGQHASIAPGQVLLNRSNDNLVCGEQVFIGMKIRDSKGQVPPDGTTVNLLATSGLLEPTSMTTVNGTANVVYTAPGATGEVRITAAAGDAFGYTTLNVRCGAGTGGITPPNTGSRITPPNTGDAGLK
jgi:hypothetical protein